MKVQAKVFLPGEVARALDEAARRMRRSKSEIMVAALASYLSPDSAEATEAAVTRRLDRMSRQIERLERDVTISSEAVALFVRTWLRNAPSLNASDDLDAAMPDLGADVRAGALGAAAAIALCWNEPRLGRADRAGLLTAWLTSHNPTYGDEFEAQAYVRGDPVAYLDAYEAIATLVEPDRRALHILEEALERAMDMVDLQSAVRARALEWAGYVGMREAFLSADRQSERQARGRHLAAMLGEAPEAGPLGILDCDLTLVPGWDPAFLLRLVARLLAQGPLADQVSLFRTAAVALSVGHAHDGWKAIKWTARLNGFDPLAADEAFRAAARALVETVGEPHPFFDVAQTAARKLYDLVSQEADEASMTALEAAVPTQWRQLLAEYDADPARSSIALSPLDVEAVSARSDIKTYVLMRRVQDHYWDPARQFAPYFRDVLLEEAAEHWKPGELSASRYNTETSILFELLDQAMARVAPEALGDYARAFARHVAEREGMPLETGLWRVEDQMIALGEPEIAALEDRLLSLDPANQDQDREDHPFNVETSTFCDGFSVAVRCRRRQKVHFLEGSESPQSAAIWPSRWQEPGAVPRSHPAGGGLRGQIN